MGKVLDSSEEEVSPIYSRRTASVAALVAALALSGSCSSNKEAVPGPPLFSTSPSPTISTPDENAEILAAVAKYEGLTRAIGAGQKYSQEEMRDVAAEPWATTIGRRLVTFQLRKISAKGSQQIVSSRISKSGSKATAVRCYDKSQVRYFNDGKEVLTSDVPVNSEVNIELLEKAENGWFQM